MIDLPKPSGYNPPVVGALEYLNTVARAHNSAGLTVSINHINTAINKLLNEQEIPKVRVMQILNRLQEAFDSGKSEVTLSFDDVRAILQSAKIKE